MRRPKKADRKESYLIENHQEEEEEQQKEERSGSIGGIKRCKQGSDANRQK